MPCILTENDIDTLLHRPGDGTIVDALLGPDNGQRSTAHWWKTTFEKYRIYVAERLKTIVRTDKNDEEALANHLKYFLKEHWETIRGSIFTYTATPTPYNTVRDALAIIAERLSQKLGEPAITLLMPDVLTEPMLSNEYPDLTTIPLSEIFNRYILFNDYYLLPVTLLLSHCKIHSKQENIYNPYYEVHSSYAEDKYLDINDITLQRLRHHSGDTQTLYDAFISYEKLAYDQGNLLGQLRTFRKKLKMYDAHSGIGSNEAAGAGTFSALVTFTEYYRNLEFCGLLVQQTIPTIADLPKGQNIGYVLVTSECLDDTTFYFLNRFDNCVTKIALNTPQASSLVAQFPQTREHCTSDELYTITTLTKHDYTSGYTHIPQVLHQRLQTFLSYQDYNTNKTHHAATCTGTNGEHIETLTEQYQDILINIGVSKRTLQLQLNTASENLDIQRALFQQKILSNTYKGCDNDLRLPLTLFQQIDVTVHVRSWADLTLLNSLPPDDILTLLTTNPALKKEIFNEIIRQDVSLFPIYLIETPIALLETVLTVLKKDIRAHFRSSFELERLFSGSLALLNHDRLTLLTRIFKDTFDSNNIVHILNNLPLDNYPTFLEAIKECLSQPPSLIFAITWQIFLTLLKNKTEQKCIAFIQAIGTHLLLFIKDANDLYLVLHNQLYSGRSTLHTIVLDGIEAHLPQLITNADKFNCILRLLSPLERSRVFNIVKATISILINTTDDFSAILEHLSNDDRVSMFYIMEEHIPQFLTNNIDIYQPLIKNMTDVQYFLCTFKEKPWAINAINARLPDIIDTTSLGAINAILNSDLDSKHILLKEPADLALLKTLILPIIEKRTFHEIAFMFSPNDEQARLTGYGVIKRLTSFNIYTILKIIQETNNRSRSELIRSHLQSHLIDYMDNTATHAEFECILRFLTLKNRNSDRFSQANILKFIESIQDIKLVLHYIARNDLNPVLMAIDTYRSNLITNIQDIHTLICSLTKEVYIDFLHMRPLRIAKLMPTEQNINFLLKHLPDDLATTTAHCLLTTMYVSPQFLPILLKDLSEERTALALHCTAKSLQKDIKTPTKLIEALRGLSHKQRILVLEKINLDTLIKNAADISHLQVTLPLETFKIICKKIDLLKLLQYPSPTELLACASQPLNQIKNSNASYMEENFRYLEANFVQAHYKRICNEYIHRLEKELKQQTGEHYDFLNNFIRHKKIILTELSSVDQLTYQKIKIVTQAMTYLNNTDNDPETNIKNCLHYLTSPEKKAILSQRRDTWLMEAAKVFCTFGLIYLYRALIGDCTKIQQSIRFFKENYPTAEAPLNENALKAIAEYHSYMHHPCMFVITPFSP